MNPQKFNRLLEKMKTDKRALEEIHNEYYPILVLYLNRRFGKLVSAEDIAQDVFVSLMETKKFEYVKAPSTWLCKAAYFKAIDNLKYRREEVPLSDDYPLPFCLDDLAIAEDVKKCLSCLDEQSQQIIYLHHWEGYTHKEIAALMGMSPANVRVKISRAYRAIKKIF